MAIGTFAAWATILGSLASAGASIYGTARQSSAADKARRDARAAAAKATVEAKKERARIENLDRERQERLRKRGSQLPPSLLSGMSGVTGAPSTLKPTLG